MKRHRIRGRMTMTTLLSFDRTCESSTNPPGKQGGLRGGSRLRDQVGVFQAEEWGGHTRQKKQEVVRPAEDTCLICLESEVLDSTVCIPLVPSLVWTPTYPKPCSFSPDSGCMQDGTALGDVQLPPWADGDPRKFISLHRQVSWPGSWPEDRSIFSISMEAFWASRGLATSASEDFMSRKPRESARFHAPG